MERRTMPVANALHRLSAQDFDLVRAIHMFDGLEAVVVDRLIGHAAAETSDEARHLFSAGDPADHFFIVLDGRVRLYALTPQGRQTTISFIEAGFSFAEAAIFGMRFFPVNAEASAGTRLVRVSRASFVAELGADPNLPFKMMAALARWRSRLIDVVAELKVRSPSQRFAAVLLSLTDRTSGPADVPLPISKSALANRIGIAPESLSRVFVRMQDLGVSVDGPLIRISDVTTLREHCHPSREEL